MSVGCTCKQVLPASCQCKKSQSLWCMEDLRASTTWLEHGSPMPKARRGGHSGAPRPGRLGIWCFEKGCTLLFLLFMVALTFMFPRLREACMWWQGTISHLCCCVPGVQQEGHLAQEEEEQGPEAQAVVVAEDWGKHFLCSWSAPHMFSILGGSSCTQAIVMPYMPQDARQASSSPSWWRSRWRSRGPLLIVH